MRTAWWAAALDRVPVGFCRADGAGPAAHVPRQRRPRDGAGRRARRTRAAVTELQQSDFELFDRGQPRRIANFDHDPGPVGVALLFDVSGSMDVGPKLERARDAAFFLLGGLESGVDEAAIYAFDSTLHVVQPFTNRLDELKGRLSSVTPWGVTSLHDAIAAAAESMGSNGSRRRALVVLTDGIDTSSRMGPAEVARIASAIDVPGLRRRDCLADRSAGCGGPARDAGGRTARRHPVGPRPLDGRTALLEHGAVAIEHHRPPDRRGAAAPVS